MAAVVALDLSRRGIRGVQIDAPYTSNPKISRYGAVSVPDGTIFDGEIIDERRATAAIKELWKSARFTTKRVTLGIANRKVVVREMTLPNMPKAQRRTSLRYAVEGQLPIDLDDAILDFLPLRDAGDERDHKQEGLLVATARGSLESTVTAVEKAGRYVDAVDFSGFALMRVLPGGETGTRAIINIGASSTTVVIATGSTPEFVRIVPSGGDDISRTMERALGVTFADAEKDKLRRGLQGGAATPEELGAENIIRENIASLIDSIRNTLNFYANAHPAKPVAGIVLTGGGSRLSGLAPVFSRALGVPTSFGDPLATFSVAKKLRGSDLERWALELAAPLGVAVGSKGGK
ncbi:type IV pilus assembly protein PilM [Microbacterium sp.]|uniref:type IV pilus assembly protein PilM n=1 Tax=Microbacterium sp. TaxID=51671 RepID=UPI002896A232|nr:type IV pilus assembly protein PilM [Microbacterium sp.]